jgi:UDP-N-acetylglucosamine pyrophosphorylase
MTTINHPPHSDWDKVKGPPADRILPYKELENVDPSILDKLVVLRLNGGLGTTMVSCAHSPFSSSFVSQKKRG